MPSTFIIGRQVCHPLIEVSEPVVLNGEVLDGRTRCRVLLSTDCQQHAHAFLGHEPYPIKDVAFDQVCGSREKLYFNIILVRGPGLVESRRNAALVSTERLFECERACRGSARNCPHLTCLWSGGKL